MDKNSNIDMTENVFVMIKPDGVGRKLIGKVITRLEESGCKMLISKITRPTPEIAAAHYRHKRNGSSGITEQQAQKYLCAGPVFISIWEGENAIKLVRLIVGANADPSKCAFGTIRRDFADDCFHDSIKENRAVRNVIHSSNNKQSAEIETNLWFGKGWAKQCVNY